MAQDSVTGMPKRRVVRHAVSKSSLMDRRKDFIK